MTNEELCALIQAGERDRLGELWAQVEKFVSMMAGRRARQIGGFGGVTAEDLYQSGFLAVVTAVDSYDPSAGKSFVGWLSMALKTAFAGAAGQRTSKRDMLDYTLDLDAPIPGTDDMLAADVVPDPSSEEAFGDADRRMYIKQLYAVLNDALNTLPEEQGAAIRGTFFDGLTLAVQAERAGVSTERIRQRQAKGMRAMRYPKINRRLRPFLYPDADVYAAGLHGNGMGAFERTGSSSTERAVLAMDERRQL